MTVTINGSGTMTGLAVGGLNDNIITKNEMATGGAWAPVGTVLQVVSGTKSGSISTTSGTFVTTNLTVSITPSSSTNKILVFVSAPFRKASSSVSGPGIAIFRDTTNVYIGISNEFYNISTQASAMASLNYLDSPNTTSTITYSLRFNSSDGSNTVTMNQDGEAAMIIAMEVAA
jgi:hypothetical protein